MPLFRRSTRSLSLTEAGADYLLAVAPALAQLRRATEDVSGRGARPLGPLRLSMPRSPFDLLIAPALAGFQTAYPDVEVEIAVEGRLIDIVKQGFDAGLRYGDLLAKDMVAVPVAPASAAILVAAPAYLRGLAPLKLPSDLLDHRAVMCRSQTTGLLRPWTLRCAGEAIQITPPAVTVVHDLLSQIELTVHGVGIGIAPLASVSAHLAAGRLLRVLPEWSTPLEALYLYFPSRRHQPAALRAFIEFLKDYSPSLAP